MAAMRWRESKTAASTSSAPTRPCPTACSAWESAAASRRFGLVLTSGFPRGARGALPPQVVFLPKPYRINALLAAIDEACSRARVMPPGG